MPRKKSEDFYKTHGFTANCQNGKYSATCNHCDRVLQNTALSRLSLHRQTCDQKRRRCPVVPTSNDIQQFDDHPRIKIQKLSADDGELDNAIEGKEIIVKIQQILDAADEESATKDISVKSEVRKSTIHPDSGEQHLEFEISNTDLPNRDYVEFIDDSKEHYILQHNVEDSVNGTTTTIVEARPKNNLAALRAEKARAEIKQFHSKTRFLKTETENLKLERTLALLRIQKLRLEIDALRTQN
ncbi:hypothetical protein KR009_004165 [Drosophila setifemur]|nr:hypothetical protein KR009_004165 [Drosophila setifemur]